MNALRKTLYFALCFGLLPVVALGKLSGQNNLLGKFFVSSVKGTVTCVSDSRIFELKKGDTVPARGAIIDTTAGANVTIVFSNGTGIYTDEKTHFEIKRFEQEFFSPNNNLRVEPSNSLTLVKLSIGRVVLSTPQLLSGTIMLYETPHASVNIRGDKLLIEVNDKQTLTHVALISGNVSVVPRGADGNFLSIGKRLTTGQEAFVKYTLTNNADDKGGVAEIDDGKKPAIQSVAEAQADNTPGTGIILGKGNAPAANKPLVTKEAQATVLKILGFARARLSEQSEEIALKEGSKLGKGALILTDAASEIYLETFKGAIATIRPNSTVQIEKLVVTTDQGVVKKQSSILQLQKGTVISTIDPATKEINDYGVRTPKGIAHASGTFFSVTVENEGFSVTTTADTVMFTPPSGATYAIKAGNITITPPGGQPQPPVSLSQALANDPGIATVIQNAMATVTTVVQNNIGGLSSDSATNLITKVTNTAASAIPAQAVSFTSQALSAVSAASSSTFKNVGAAVSAVTTAGVTAAPTQAVQISSAAVQALPDQAATIAASSSKAAPSLAPEIAAAVTKVVTPSSPQGPSQSTIQTATAIATAVTNSVPSQAATVAAAVMQTIAQSSPQATPESNAQSASAIASGVSAAAPIQAVPVAALMMKTLMAISPDATPASVAQTAALLATSVTSVVPPQAQEVATAVMKALVQALPKANSDATAGQAAGLVTAAVSQIAPSSSQSIAEGVAGASGLSVATVQETAQQSSAQATQVTQQASGVSQQVAQSTQQSNQAAQSVAQAGQIANAAPGSANTPSNATPVTSPNQATNTPSNTAPAGPVANNTPANNTPSSPGNADPSSTTNNPVDRPTSIIVTQFDPGAALGIIAGLDQASAGANSVAPTTSNPGGGTAAPTGGGGPGPNIIFTPVVPTPQPVDTPVSPASLTGG